MQVMDCRGDKRPVGQVRDLGFAGGTKNRACKSGIPFAGETNNRAGKSGILVAKCQVF
jgi:hypothetical protein